MYSETRTNIIGLNQGKVLKEFNEEHEKYIDFKKEYFRISKLINIKANI